MFQWDEILCALMNIDTQMYGIIIVSVVEVFDLYTDMAPGKHINYPKVHVR